LLWPTNHQSRQIANEMGGNEIHVTPGKKRFIVMRRWTCDKTVRVILVLTCIASGNVGSAHHGGMHTWTESAGGLFADAGNWDSGVPGDTDTALFNLPDTYAVAFGLFGAVDEENSKLNVTSGDVTLNLRGGLGGEALYELTSNSDPSISVTGPFLGLASLTVGWGELKARDAVVGGAINSNGTVTVTNSGFWNLTGTATIGTVASGTVIVEDASEFRTTTTMMGTACQIGGFPCGNGTVTLRDLGSKWQSNLIYVGGSSTASAGSGTINIQGGTELEVLATLKLWPGSIINLTGGTLDTRILDHTGGTLNWTSGTLIIDDTDMVMDTGEWLDANRILSNNMSLQLGQDLTIGQSGTAMLHVTEQACAFVGNQGGIGTLGYEGSGDGSLFMDSPNATWSGSLNVGGHTGGTGGTGLLDVQAGATGSGSRLSIGVGSGSTGNAVIAGPTTSWQAFERVTVGDAGSGELSVGAGASLSSRDSRIGDQAGAVGAVNIETGALWQVDATITDTRSFIVGNEGSGELNITGGSTVSQNRFVDSYLGWADGADGTVIVEDANSSWTIGEVKDSNFKDLVVGFNGNGSLEILAGGLVASRAGYVAVGADSVSTAMVDGANSAWTMSNLLAVAVAGFSDGTLIVSNGGDVETTGLFVATEPDSIGCVTVDDGTLRVVDGNVNMPELVLGGAGTAIVNVINGGSISGGDAFIGDAIDSDGTLTVSGADSAIEIDNELAVAYDGIGVMSLSAGPPCQDRRDSCLLIY